MYLRSYYRIYTCCCLFSIRLIKSRGKFLLRHRPPICINKTFELIQELSLSVVAKSDIAGDTNISNQRFCGNRDRAERGGSYICRQVVCACSLSLLYLSMPWLCVIECDLCRCVSSRRPQSAAPREQASSYILQAMTHNSVVNIIPFLCAHKITTPQGGTFYT